MNNLWSMGLGKRTVRCMALAGLLLLSLAGARAWVIPASAPDFPTDTMINVKYLMGKYNAATDLVFSEVEAPYAGRKGIYLREETYGAFINMYNAAQREGVELVVVSGVRSFAHQKSLWEAKWFGRVPVEGKNMATTVKDPVERARIILKYTAMPGTSRHHWGTDLDLNSTEPDYFESPEGMKVYAWLCANAGRYGFVQPYTAKGDQRPVGFEEEKWHWTHVHISRYYMEAWRNHVTYADILGFAGAATADSLNIIEDYVLGVNPDCK